MTQRRKRKIHWGYHLTAFLIVLVTVLMAFVAYKLPPERYLSWLASMRLTSSIIFGVIGAWLSIVYLGLLKKIFDGNLSSINDAELDHVTYQLWPLYISILALISTLVLEFVIPIAQEGIGQGSTANVLKGLTFVFIFLLAIAQLWSLVVAMIPFKVLQDNVAQVEHDRYSQRRFGGRQSHPMPAADANRVSASGNTSQQT